MHQPDIQRVIEIIAERKIEEAMQEGKFDNLPGRGKPLPMDEEWFVPPEMRPAIRLLKSAGVLPDWMERAREIERIRAHYQRLWLIAEREYPRICEMGEERFLVWQSETWQGMVAAIQQINAQVLAYNCTAPATAHHQLPLQSEAEHARFLQRFSNPFSE
ncbi:MAG: DUF1992 domain-containing protein [Fimbriimonadales bacterium]